MITTAFTGKTTAPIFASFTFSEDEKQVIGNLQLKQRIIPKSECVESYSKKNTVRSVHTEKNASESRVSFDIRFFAVAPKLGELIRLI